MFDALRRIVRAGASWRMMPHDLPPPWAAVFQQTQRWLAAGVFEQIVHDLRALLRPASGRGEEPSAAVFDGRVMQSTCESGGRCGWDGHRRREGSKAHTAVDTLGHLLALHVTAAAAEQERAQVKVLARRVQEVTGGSAEPAYVDRGYTGDEPAKDAEGHGIRPEVVKHAEAKRGFVLLPRRWLGGRPSAWPARFRRRPARDYERLPRTLAGLHFVAFACLMLARIAKLIADGP